MENTVLCGSNAYKKKYYLNEAFQGLPENIKKELKIMCVLFTEEVGGILTVEYEVDGSLILKITHEEDDLLFDEIGSVLKVKQLQNSKQELLEALELYYRVFIMKRPEGEAHYAAGD